MDFMSDKEIALVKPDNKEQEIISPDISPEKKDLNTLQTTVETANLKTEVIDTVEIDNDWSYEIIKWSKMYDKLLILLWTENKVEKFALDIDKVIRKYLDQELDWFPNSIKNSMSVGIQFAMMETLIKQWVTWSAQFFDAFSKVKSQSSTQAFQWLYTSFGTLWSANEFYVLANKVQNMTWYLSDKKNIILASKNIPELIDPNQCKELLKKNIWSTQVQVDAIDITTLLTLHSSQAIDIHAGESELKKIVNNDALSDSITEKTLLSLEKSLKTADTLFETRGKFKDKASDLVSTIAWLLDITLPFLWNIGEMIGMEFPTDILWEKKDGWVLNFVLGVLGFHGGVKWLHKDYIQEKLDEISIDNAFITDVYTDFQKNKDTTITHDSSSSIWKVCWLIAPDSTVETTMKAKLPTDYMGLKKSLVDTLDTTTLHPTMVAKFAPELITTQNDLPVVDIHKIKDNKDAFIDRYLKYIIPLLAQDDFMRSPKTDTNSFTLAVIWGLIGDKYFIEGVNIGLISPATFIPPSSLWSPEIVANQWTLEVVHGKIDFSKGKFTPEQIKNINFLIDEMNTRHITDPITQIWILSVIAKESGFVPKNEHSYENTSNQEIRKIFWNRVPTSDSELTELKKNPEAFFNRVYENTVGNAWWNDGRRYRGRGYNQLTGKGNYTKYSELTGTDILHNPDTLNDPIVASKVALAFFTKGKEDSSFPQFTSKNDAAIYFADINAGGRAGGHRTDAVHAAENFDIQTAIA